MKFERAVPDGLAIVAYSSAGIQIANQVYRGHLLLTPEQIIDNWPAPAPSELTIDSFARILTYAPEVLILGTGETLEFPPASLNAALAAKRIGLEVMDTQAACRTYNILLTEDRRVAAALIQVLGHSSL